MMRSIPRPAMPLVYLLIGWALLGLAVSLELFEIKIWVVCGALLALVAVFDGVGVWFLTTPELRRELPSILPLGRSHEVILRLHNHSSRVLHCDLHDHHPLGWHTHELPATVNLKPQQQLDLAYSITPDTRGTHEFTACDLRVRSPWRLWQQRRRLALPQSVRVYPNFAPLARFALISAEQATRVIGAHMRRRRGEGTEFQQLREYRVGDSMRQIDWKATQRSGKLISREYQQERNQQIILWLDTGRRMMAQDAALSHFDHALNAALMLSYIALRQGDAVGMLASGGDTRWFKPMRGMGAIDVMLQSFFDLQAKPVATDYLEAARQIAGQQQRRALIIMLTNARDEDSEDLLNAVKLLQRKHLVMVASLREQVLDQVLHQPIHKLEDASLLGATLLYLRSRTHAHKVLSAQGSEVLDVTAEQLPASLVERYLAIKRAGVL